MEGAAGSKDNQVDAKTITFDSDDLALAEVIQAVLNPTAQQQALNVQAISTSQAGIAANQQRIDANKANLDEVAQSTQKRLDEMGEVVTKDRYTVLFTTGDYSLSDEAKQRLAYSKGWDISVAGYADAVGNAASHQVLSKERAQAVVAYLLQECGVPVGRALAPGAMGETNPAASSESPSGRAENLDDSSQRKVEILTWNELSE